jgi:hypothetical protein
MTALRVFARLLIWILSTTGFGKVAHADAEPRIEAVLIFATVPFDEIADASGRYINPTTVDPPLTEYRRLERWDPAEVSSSPSNFDAIAIVSGGHGLQAGDAVRFDVFAKAGQLVVSPEVGVTDTEKGRKSAKWSSQPIASQSVPVGESSPGTRRAVVARNFDLSRFAAELHAKGQWPFAINIEATLHCGRCVSPASVETTLELLPGD